MNSKHAHESPKVQRPAMLSYDPYNHRRIENRWWPWPQHAHYQSHFVKRNQNFNIHFALHLNQTTSRLEKETITWPNGFANVKYVVALSNATSSTEDLESI